MLRRYPGGVPAVKPGRTSVYLSQTRAAAAAATGKDLLQLIDDGIAANMPVVRDAAGTVCPPHPRRRVMKGLCGACGRNVNGEKVA